MQRILLVLILCLCTNLANANEWPIFSNKAEGALSVANFLRVANEGAVIEHEGYNYKIIKLDNRAGIESLLDEVDTTVTISPKGEEADNKHDYLVSSNEKEIDIIGNVILSREKKIAVIEMEDLPENDSKVGDSKTPGDDNQKPVDDGVAKKGCCGKCTIL